MLSAFWEQQNSHTRTTQAHDPRTLVRVLHAHTYNSSQLGPHERHTLAGTCMLNCRLGTYRRICSMYDIIQVLPPAAENTQRV